MAYLDLTTLSKARHAARKTRRLNDKKPDEEASIGLRRSFHLESTIEERNLDRAQHEKEFSSHCHTSTASPASATTEIALPPMVHGKIPQSSHSRATGLATTDDSSSGTQNCFYNTMRLANLFHKNSEERRDSDRMDTKESEKSKRLKAALDREIPAKDQIRAVLFDSWINLLLLAIPVAFVVQYLHVNGIAIFIVNFIAIIPLAAILSNATQEISIRVGDTAGGLLNATFGNAVELIVSILALIKGQITIVKTSLIGSMLSNLLLVLGMCFFFGGINRVEQNFNNTVADTSSSLLFLSTASLIIPTVFHFMLSTTSSNNSTPNQELSRGTSVILLIVYGCSLVFQFKTHAEMYNAPSQKVPKRKQSALASEAEEEDGEIVEPHLTIWGALITLGISTALVALCSDFMVGSISDVTASGTVSTTFVGLILIPIVGNATEHVTAVTVAVKDKMDLAIGVAVGSCTQIALLVLPFIVVIGWAMGRDCMTLYLDIYQLAIVFVAVLLVNHLIQDGKSNWLEGALLMATYTIIALASWVYPKTVVDPVCPT